MDIFPLCVDPNTLYYFAIGGFCQISERVVDVIHQILPEFLLYQPPEIKVEIRVVDMIKEELFQEFITHIQNYLSLFGTYKMSVDKFHIIIKIDDIEINIDFINQLVPFIEGGINYENGRPGSCRVNRWILLEMGQRYSNHSFEQINLSEITVLHDQFRIFLEKTQKSKSSYVIISNFLRFKVETGIKLKYLEIPSSNYIYLKWHSYDSDYLETADYRVNYKVPETIPLISDSGIRFVNVADE